MDKLSLGDAVHCTRYIKGAKNYFHLEPPDYPCLHSKLMFHDAKLDTDVEVDTDSEETGTCDRIKFIDTDFNGIYVGTTEVKTQICWDFGDEEIGQKEFIFSRTRPIKVAIVYFGLNRKRLVPLDSIMRKE